MNTNFISKLDRSFTSSAICRTASRANHRSTAPSPFPVRVAGRSDEPLQHCRLLLLLAPFLAILIMPPEGQCVGSLSPPNLDQDALLSSYCPISTAPIPTAPIPTAPVSTAPVSTAPVCPAPVSSPTPQCCGMPLWSVSEPAANLWLSDIPLLYNAGRGRSMRFQLYYKNRLGTQGTVDNTAYEVFSVGARWHTSWRSYVQPVTGEATNYWVILGDGTALRACAKTNSDLSSEESCSSTLAKWDA